MANDSEQASGEATEPSLQDLKDRAGELDISGRSKMNADELAAAIEIAEAAEANKANADAPRYTRERLLTQSRDFLGHRRAVVAGAFHAMGGDGDVTLAEANAAIERFLTTPHKEG